jgi:hypothetical protein
MQVTRYTLFRYPRFRIFTVLFHCHGVCQYPIRGHVRSFYACPVSCGAVSLTRPAILT